MFRIRLPFTSRRVMRDEIENLMAQLQIVANERRKEGANHRNVLKQLDEINEEAKVLRARIAELEQSDLHAEVERLQKELNETKDTNRGLISSINDLKRRNQTLYAKLRQAEEAIGIKNGKNDGHGKH